MSTMPRAIEREITFLKEFKKRFSSTVAYKMAVGDLLDQGLITRVAYEAIIKSTRKKRKRNSIKNTKMRRQADEYIGMAGSCGATVSHC
jgi:hypothetical protein